MSKGRFLNQKLGKRTDRKAQLLKARLKVQRLSRPSNNQRASGSPSGLPR